MRASITFSIGIPFQHKTSTPGDSRGVHAPRVDGVDEDASLAALVARLHEPQRERGDAFAARQRRQVRGDRIPQPGHGLDELQVKGGVVEIGGFLLEGLQAVERIAASPGAALVRVDVDSSQYCDGIVDDVRPRGRRRLDRRSRDSLDLRG